MEIGLRYIYATFVITFGSSFQFGYQTGVINAPLPLFQKFIADVMVSRNASFNDAFVSSMSSLIVAGFPVGGVIGALIGGSMANKMGRKLSLFIMNVPMAAGSVLMMGSKAANTFEMIIIGRILVGLACGSFTGIAPVYLAEIAPIKIRGASGITHQLAVVTAILLSQVFGLIEIMGTDSLWPYLIGLSIIPSVVLLLLLWTCPDSPRHLLLNRFNEESARSALHFYRSEGANLDEEIEELLHEQQTLDAPKFRIRDLFRSPPLRMAVLICIVTHLSQQFSGINATLFYSTSLFESVGLKGATAAYATLGVGAAIVGFTIISLFIIEVIGRRTLLVSGLGIMLGSGVMITIGLSLRNNSPPMAYFAIAFVYIFVGGFAIGPGSIPWFIVAEIFPQESVDAVIVITVFVNWVSQIVISIGFPQLLIYLSDFAFLPFVVFLAIFIGLISHYLPETKGRSPADVQKDFVRMAGPKMVELDEPDYNENKTPYKEL